MFHVFYFFACGTCCINGPLGTTAATARASLGSHRGTPAEAAAATLFAAAATALAAAANETATTAATAAADGHSTRLSP